MFVWTTVWVLAAAAASTQAVERYDMANHAYRNGDFATAIGNYQRVLELTGPNAAAHYNLGNAFYQSGDLPGAIASYERALQLEPGLDAARQNLSFAVRQTERKLPRPERFRADSVLFWQSRLGQRTLTVVALCAWAGFWTVLALRQWRPVPYARAAAAILLLIAGATGVSAWFRAHPPLLAVAAADRVPVRYGVSEADTVRFELYAGDRAAVDGVQDGWARVQTADGERGWAQVEQLILVGPVGDAALMARGGAR